MSQCMSRPRVTYNGESSVSHVPHFPLFLFPVDTLAQDSGECSICLDDMVPGNP